MARVSINDDFDEAWDIEPVDKTKHLKLGLLFLSDWSLITLIIFLDCIALHCLIALHGIV